MQGGFSNRSYFWQVPLRTYLPKDIKNADFTANLKYNKNVRCGEIKSNKNKKKLAAGLNEPDKWGVKAQLRVVKQ